MSNHGNTLIPSERSHGLANAFRTLPQSADAEKGIICSILLAPDEAGDYCTEKGVSKSSFHVPAHGELYDAMQKIRADNEPLDFIVLTEHMQSIGRIDNVGGPAAIAELFTYLPTAANLPSYVEIVQQKHVLREVIRIGTEYTAKAYNGDDALELLASFERKVMSIGSERYREAAQTTREIIMESIMDIEKAHEAKSGMKGMPTGIRELDEHTGGIGAEEFVVLQAERSHGKTSLALTLAAHYAIDLKIPTGYISLETPPKQLAKRIIAARARVEIKALLRGQLERPDGLDFDQQVVDPFVAVTRAASQIADAPLHFDYQRGLMATEIAAKARRMVSRHGIRILFIDFLQKMGEDKRQSDKRSDRIAANSLALSNLCGDLGIAVVMLSQENKDGEAFGSSEIANDADLQIAIHTTDDEEFELIILKQKDGERNQRIPVWFDKACTAFRNPEEQPTKPAAPGAGKKSTRSR